jgi:hypothetical protein
MTDSQFQQTNPTLRRAVVSNHAEMREQILKHAPLTLLGPDFMQIQPDGRYLIRFGNSESYVSTLSEVQRVHRENVEYYLELATLGAGL